MGQTGKTAETGRIFAAFFTGWFVHLPFRIFRNRRQAKNRLTRYPHGPDGDGDRHGLRGHRGNGAQETGGDDDRHNDEGPDKVSRDAVDRVQGLFLKAEIGSDPDLSLFRHVQRFGRPDGGIRDPLEEMQKLHGDPGVHLSGILKVQPETRVRVHLAGEVVQDVDIGAQRFDGSLHGHDAPHQIGEEGIDFEVLVLEAAQDGAREIPGIEVAEIGSAVLGTHALAHLRDGAVADLAPGLGHLQDRTLQGTGVMHDHTGDNVNEKLPLPGGQGAHHAEINPFDAVLRKGKGGFSVLSGPVFICRFFREQNR